MKQQGMFDMLNDTLSVQIDRLMNAEGDALEGEIKRSNAVSQLAMNINRNMSNAVNVSKIIAADGADMRSLKKALPAMMGGGDEGE